jgi:hypothetical protein
MVNTISNFTQISLYLIYSDYQCDAGVGRKREPRLSAVSLAHMIVLTTENKNFNNLHWAKGARVEIPFEPMKLMFEYMSYM